MRSLPLFAVPEYRAVLLRLVLCFVPLAGVLGGILMMRLALAVESSTAAYYLIFFGLLLTSACLATSILSAGSLPKALKIASASRWIRQLPTTEKTGGTNQMK